MTEIREKRQLSGKPSKVLHWHSMEWWNSKVRSTHCIDKEWQSATIVRIKPVLFVFLEKIRIAFVKRRWMIHYWWYVLHDPCRWWWWWWWWWIVFVVWLTDERHLVVFPAGIIVRYPHHRESPRAGFEPAQNMNSALDEWSCVVVITTTLRCRE